MDKKVQCIRCVKQLLEGHENKDKLELRECEEFEARTEKHMIIEPKDIIKDEYTFTCAYPWIVNFMSSKGCTILDGELTLKDIEDKYKPVDGDKIIEVRPLVEYTFIREKGKWYRQKTGEGYA